MYMILHVRTLQVSKAKSEILHVFQNQTCNKRINESYRLSDHSVPSYNSMSSGSNPGQGSRVQLTKVFLLPLSLVDKWVPGRPWGG